MESTYLSLETSMEAEALRDLLRRWEPWSIRVDFSNGVSTREFVRRVPFVEHPLNKLALVSDRIPFAKLRGGWLLDLGCNAGYNSIYIASTYGLSCHGIDVVDRHLESAQFFAQLAGVTASFERESAETFTRPAAFDVVLHFGTLYHLPSPYLSLQTTFNNLRPGGYLALETQVYDHPEDANICYFMHMQNNDATNFWALSTSVLTKCLQLVGFKQIEEVRKVVPAHGLAQYMARVVLIARKPE
jgi:2-polyprenyl-3-methyl-5-hydroxy-6-metoxy-1,4-benzoquinol methylase